MLFSYHSTCTQSLEFILNYRLREGVTPPSDYPYPPPHLINYHSTRRTPTPPYRRAHEPRLRSPTLDMRRLSSRDAALGNRDYRDGSPIEKTEYHERMRLSPDRNYNRGPSPQRYERPDSRMTAEWREHSRPQSQLDSRRSPVRKHPELEHRQHGYRKKVPAAREEQIDRGRRRGQAADGPMEQQMKKPEDETRSRSREGNDRKRNREQRRQSPVKQPARDGKEKRQAVASKSDRRGSRGTGSVADAPRETSVTDR